MQKSKNKDDGQRGESLSLYIDRDIASRIRDHAKDQDRSESQIANNLLRQALANPLWKWRRMDAE